MVALKLMHQCSIPSSYLKIFANYFQFSLILINTFLGLLSMADLPVASEHFQLYPIVGANQLVHWHKYTIYLTDVKVCKLAYRMREDLAPFAHLSLNVYNDISVILFC